MANPTTNYGFVLPTPTDLVTDLPADFDVALQGVDTQMLTNANAAIAKTIVDAKGDIIAATGADAVSRLAVGANNTVLTADSATATGLKWAAAASDTNLLGYISSTSSYSTTSASLVKCDSAFNVTFIAPASGRVLLRWSFARFNTNGTATGMSIAFVTVANADAGSTEYNGIQSNTSDIGRLGTYAVVVTGLTATNSYTFYPGFASSNSSYANVISARHLFEVWKA